MIAAFMVVGVVSRHLNRRIKRNRAELEVQRRRLQSLPSNIYHMEDFISTYRKTG